MLPQRARRFPHKSSRLFLIAGNGVPVPFFKLKQMKKIILAITLLVAIAASGQSPFPIQQSLGSSSTLVFSRGGLRSDSVWLFPVFADTTAANRGPFPRYYPGNTIRCGNDLWMRNTTATAWIKITDMGAHTHIFADITDGTPAVRNLFSGGTGISYNPATGVFIATGNGNANIYNQDSTLAANRTVFGSNDSRGLTFDSLNYFTVTRNATSRIYMNNMSSGIFSPDGQISVQASNTVAQMNAGAGNNLIYAYTDSSVLQNPTGNYRFKNLVYQNDTSLFKPAVVGANGQIYSSSWFGVGVAGSGLDSIAVIESPLIDSLYQYNNGDSALVHIFDHNCGLVQPGLVTHDSLLIFTVSPSVEISCCDGLRRTYPETHITLTAADATFPRYDAIVLDQATNTVIKITGAATADPVLPQPGDCQTVLTYIYVPALATTPGNFQSVTIYDENTGAPEWPGAATSATVNFNGGNPYHLTKSTDIGAVTAASRLDYTTTDSIKITNFSVLTFYIRLKASFASNTKFVVSFWNNNIQRSTGVTVQHGSYGFNRTLIGTYEKIAIPITDFGFYADTVDALRIQLTGSNASGFYVDWITLQGGINQPIGGGTTSQRFAVEDNTQKENRYFNGKDFGYFDIDSIKSLVMSFNPAGGYRVKDFTTALPDNDIIRYNTSEYSLDPLTKPMYIKNLPASDTATYVMGVTTGNRLVRQTKSALGVPGWDQVLSQNQSFSISHDVNLASHALSLYNASKISMETIGTGKTLSIVGLITSNHVQISTYNDSTTALKSAGIDIISSNSTTNSIISVANGNGNIMNFAVSDSAIVVSNTAGNGSKIYVDSIRKDPGKMDLRYNPTTKMITAYDTTVGGSVTPPLSSIIAATATNNFDNADFLQEWKWNSLTNSGFKISSTSTAAASNLQRLLDVSLSGANSNINQTTKTISGSNSHTGTGATNYGVVGEVTNGASTSAGVYGLANTNQYGVLGSSSSGTGVNGTSLSGIGVQATATSGIGIFASNNGTNPTLDLQAATSTTSSGIVMVKYDLQTSGTAAAGFGQIFDHYIERADNSLINAHRFVVNLSNAGGAGSTQADLSYYLQDAGVLTEMFRLEGNGNSLLGMGGARSTSATDGFVYIPTCAGTPTGTPTTKSGMVPMIWDSTNHKLYLYDNGVWNVMN